MGIRRRHVRNNLVARNSLAILDPLEPRQLFTATPIGTYALGGRTPTVLTDADGTIARLSLPAGKGTVTVADDGWHVTVMSAASPLTLTAKGGDGRLHIDDVRSRHPLTLDATGAKLTGSLTLTNVTRVTLGKVPDLSLTSTTPLSSLAATTWTNTDSVPDAVTAPSIASLNVKRAFAADLTLKSKKVALNSATVGGAVTGTWSVAGSAGTLKLHAVRSPDLTIRGNVRALTLDDGVAIAPRNAATYGVIHFGSKGSVSASKGKDTFQVARNVTIYTAAKAADDYADLSGNTRLGAKRTYRRDGKTRVAQVSAQTQKIKGASAYTYSLPGLNGESDTYSADPAAGTRLFSQSADSDAVSLDSSFDGAGLKIAPAALTLGATTRGTSPVTLRINDEDVGGTLRGSAVSATHFASHELVPTPAGTFLAAKVITTLTFSASGTIGDGENSASSSVVVGTTYTQWFAPGIGAVRVDTARAVTIKVPSVGITRTHRTATKDELTKRP